MSNSIFEDMQFSNNTNLSVFLDLVWTEKVKGPYFEHINNKSSSNHPKYKICFIAKHHTHLKQKDT